MRDPRRCGEDAQTTVEYLGMLTVVVLVLGAVTATVPGIRGHFADRLAAATCGLTGDNCPDGVDSAAPATHARAGPVAPAPITSDHSHVSSDLAVATVAGEDAPTVELTDEVLGPVLPPSTPPTDNPDRETTDPHPSTPTPTAEPVTEPETSWADGIPLLRRFFAGHVHTADDIDDLIPSAPDLNPWSEPADGFARRVVGRLVDEERGSQCTASVVASESRNVILTAGHCVAAGISGGHRLVFYPGYEDGEAPHGGWVVQRAFMPAEVSRIGNDFAFLAVAPREDGRQVQDVTGAFGLKFGRAQPTNTHFFGYPESDPERLHACRDDAGGPGGHPVGHPHAASLLRVACHRRNGMSGGPYVGEYDSEHGYGYLHGIHNGGLRSVGSGASFGTMLNSEALRLYHAADRYGTQHP